MAKDNQSRHQNNRTGFSGKPTSHDEPDTKTQPENGCSNGRDEGYDSTKNSVSTTSQTTPKLARLEKPNRKWRMGKRRKPLKEDTRTEIEKMARKMDTEMEMVEETIKIGCWNIRRGLLRREKELEELLNRENIQIMFLVETDDSMIKEKNDNRIRNYTQKIRNKNAFTIQTHELCFHL